MIADLRPYPTYRDSGVPWLGAIPSHWDLTPNRALIKRRKVLVGGRHGDYRLLSLTKQGVIVRDLTGGKGKFSSDMGTSQEVRIGDLVFCLFDVPETPRTVGLARHNGMITGAYSVFECFKNNNAPYFELYYRALDDRKLLSPLYSGLRNTIPASLFLGIKTPQPPPAEQAAIVRFLDYADRRIKRYIRAKRQLIGLLTEQKQAIIHRAVTRGLDPNVRLKPSGVEWLGDIPEHWRPVRLQRIISPISQGWSPQCDAFPASEEEWGVLKVGCVNRGTLDGSQNKRLPKDLQPDPLLEIRDGDILVSRANTRQLIGLAAVARRPRSKLILCDKLFRFRALEDVADAEFLVSSIRSKNSRAQIESRTNGASDSMQNIGQAVLSQLMVAVPPIAEQRQIASALAKLAETADLLAASTLKEIDLLREYRTRLIADVVTGKLDVRAAAAALPAEPEVDEELPELDEMEAEDGDEAELADAEE